MLSIALVFCLVGSSMAQLASLGACPDLQPVTNFNVTGFMGKWYEQGRTHTLFDQGSQCVATDFTLSGTGNVAVHYEKLATAGKMTILDGVADFAESYDVAKFSVSYPESPVEVAVSVFVLDTDYDNWAVFWSCTEFPHVNIQFSRVVTKQANPSAEVLEAAWAAVEKKGLSRDNYSTTVNTNCPSEY